MLRKPYSEMTICSALLEAARHCTQLLTAEFMAQFREDDVLKSALSDLKVTPNF